MNTNVRMYDHEIIIFLNKSSDHLLYLMSPPDQWKDKDYELCAAIITLGLDISVAI